MEASTVSHTFRDRSDAGRQLADLLEERNLDADIVLAIPRGGLPIGRVVADRLGVPLDIVSARKIGSPTNPELAVGAVASDGTTWLNESLIDELDIEASVIESRIQQEREAALGKVERYRAGRPPLEVHAKAVLLVDDGIATGATTIACIRQLQRMGADSVVVAVPVAPPDTVDRLRTEADDVLCVQTPHQFRAVGQFYDTFDQVSDERARTYLDA